MTLQPSSRVPVIEFFDEQYRKYMRYWQYPNRDATDPIDFPRPWSDLLRLLQNRPKGRAVDLGAGEGSDAIRLARLGYEVDAIDASAIGAEKIEQFARQAGVRLNVINADARTVPLEGRYDVVICNGLLHYVEDKVRLIQKIQGLTAPEGLNLVFLFSDQSPVPECHQITEVFCDKENGVAMSAYRLWNPTVHFERNKADVSHPGFPPHEHSMIKILGQKPR